MKNPVRQMNLIIDFDIIHNELYANVNKEIVKHKGFL
jgi:hypothetical protein